MRPVAKRTAVPAIYDARIIECRARGQTRPTPRLHYRAGDAKRLHQYLYGSFAPPLQVGILLSDTSSFSDGEFRLVERRARL